MPLPVPATLTLKTIAVLDMMAQAWGEGAGKQGKLLKGGGYLRRAREEGPAQTCWGSQGGQHTGHTPGRGAGGTEQQPSPGSAQLEATGGASPWSLGDSMWLRPWSGVQPTGGGGIVGAQLQLCRAFPKIRWCPGRSRHFSYAQPARQKDQGPGVGMVTSLCPPYREEPR